MKTLAPRLSCNEHGDPSSKGTTYRACDTSSNPHEIDESKLNERRATLLKMEQEAGQPIDWMRKILF